MVTQTILAHGSNWVEIPGKKVAHIDFQHPDGHIMYGLPADPYHYNRYIARGFKPITGALPQVIPPVVEAKVELPVEEKIPEVHTDPPQVGFECKVCGKVLSTKLARAGHSRKHQTKEK
jgi:hypothetical protein